MYTGLCLLSISSGTFWVSLSVYHFPNLTGHPLFKPPGLKVLLVFLHHMVALEAAALAQVFQDLHQANFAAGRQTYVHICKEMGHRTLGGTTLDFCFYTLQPHDFSLIYNTDKLPLPRSNSSVAGWPAVRGQDDLKPSHLVSYLDSFLSSQAVLPPPKFCLAVLSKP